VLEPDCLIIQDTTLLHQAELFTGLSERGFLILNTAQPVHELGIEEIVDFLPEGHVCSSPANEVSAKHLGRPRPNAVLLGAFTTLTGVIQLESLVEAITEKFPGPIGEKNAAAATEAAQSIHIYQREPA
jgi:pyruvate ferredoxin oxidoreductase gamma subunit